MRGIGFTFSGGAFYGKGDFHTTEREFVNEHVGEANIRNDIVERVP